MMDRVVSLAPSATSIIQALGVDDRLVGATDHGDHDAPTVGGWLQPDLDRVDQLDPDLVVTTDGLQSTVVEQLTDRGYDPLHLSPRTLPDVYRSIERLGAVLAVEETADAVAADMRSELTRLRETSAGGTRPVVYCEEWSEPPMAAGNWVPELVEIAGGAYPFRAPGERSATVDRATVERHRPEHVIVHVCGRSETVDREDVLDRDWEIPAIEQGNIWVVDDRLLNQPAPTLVEGARTLRNCIQGIAPRRSESTPATEP